jgi:acyl carrier protein
MNAIDIDTRIRAILKEHGRLSNKTVDLPDYVDLHQQGMTSHATVNVMLALEVEFDVEFPDQMLTRNVFNSIASIRTALAELIPARSSQCVHALAS